MISVKEIAFDLLKTRQEKYAVIESSSDKGCDVNIYFFNDLREIFEKYQKQIKEGNTHEKKYKEKILKIQEESIVINVDIDDEDEKYNIKFCYITIINITKDECDELYSMSK